MINAIINGINSVFSLFYIIILIRCALSFIQGIDYRKQPYQAIMQVTDPYLNIFKKIIPPIGMVDISPVIAIFALGIIQSLVVYMIVTIYGALGLN
jgi:YggT family protein